MGCRGPARRPTGTRKVSHPSASARRWIAVSPVSARSITFPPLPDTCGLQRRRELVTYDGRSRQCVRSRLNPFCTDAPASPTASVTGLSWSTSTNTRCPIQASTAIAATTTARRARSCPAAAAPQTDTAPTSTQLTQIRPRLPPLLGATTRCIHMTELWPTHPGRQ